MLSMSLKKYNRYNKMCYASLRVSFLQIKIFGCKILHNQDKSFFTYTVPENYNLLKRDHQTQVFALLHEKKAQASHQ